MNVRQMVVVEFSLIGSIAKRSIAFPIVFNRRKTNRKELGEIVAVQLREELGKELVQCVQTVTVYFANQTPTVACTLRNRQASMFPSYAG